MSMYVPEIVEEVSENTNVLIEEDGKIKRVPKKAISEDISASEIVDEVSENAKFLMEDNGKIVRTNRPNNNFYYVDYMQNNDGGFEITSYDDEIFNLSIEELLCNVFTRMRLKGEETIGTRRLIYAFVEGDFWCFGDGNIDFVINKVDKTIFVE